MNSFELHDLIERFRKEIKGHRIISFLMVCGARGTSLVEEVAHFLEKVEESPNTPVPEFSHFIAGLRQWKPREVFSELAGFQALFGRLGDDVPELRSFTTKLEAQLERFGDLFSEVLLEGQRAEALRLALVGSEILERINSLSTSLTVIAAVTSMPSQEGSREAAELLLHFESEADLTVVVRKLAALQQLYSEIAQVLAVSEQENPVTLSRAEAGSFWTELLGYPRIVQLMEDLLKRGIAYIHRNYTREGRIESIPRGVNAIEEILQLRDTLHGMGVDTAALDEHIQKASVAIGQQLNTLLGGESRIRINTVVYPIATPDDARMLGAAPLLPLPTDKPDENQT